MENDNQNIQNTTDTEDLPCDPDWTGAQEEDGWEAEDEESGWPEEEEGTPIPPIGDLSQRTYDPKDFLLNYNEAFRGREQSPALQREGIIRQLYAVLIGMNKPNALLIGAAGVGKTYIVESLAHLLATGDASVPPILKDSVVYEFSLTSMIANSSYVGDIEAKAKCVVEFAEDPENHAILFIDEMHQLMQSATGSKIAQILKPALSRGRIRVIGATTLQESQDLLSDPAFNRRFTRIEVDELTREQTVQILRQALPSMEEHYQHQVLVSKEVLERTALYADRYRRENDHRPDNAITLLDRAMAETVIRQGSDTTTQGLSGEQVRETARRLLAGNSTGGQVEEAALRQHLGAIRGQDDVIEELITRVMDRQDGLFPSSRPMTLLFAGSSGVGKTEAAKILSQELTGTPPITLNMTEYTDASTINRIIGSPAGYIGSDSHAELPFDGLEANPYQVILLDEFEKCDPAVQRLFMQVFDEGTLKTNRGKKVDFTKTIIIATTNAAHGEGCSIGFLPKTGENNRTRVRDLSRFLDPAILNRFEKILTFHDIGAGTYRQILMDLYAKDRKAVLSEHPDLPLQEQIPEEDLDLLVQETFVPEFGARPAERTIRAYIRRCLKKEHNN